MDDGHDQDERRSRPDKRPEKRAGKQYGERRARPRPIDARQLDEMALAYVARFATSAGRLGAYLTRKIRERGWAGDDAADVAATVARLVGLGYVDDAGFAQARGAGMLRRGLGARRIGETLTRDGIAAPLVAEASGTEHQRRRAALSLAQRRRLGPFGRGSESLRETPPDQATRAKQVATMVRAGHPLAFARALVEARDIAAAQEWVDEADDSPLEG